VKRHIWLGLVIVKLGTGSSGRKLQTPPMAAIQALHAINASAPAPVQARHCQGPTAVSSAHGSWWTGTLARWPAGTLAGHG
jgi:hypothetical protein